MTEDELVNLVREMPQIKQKETWFAIHRQIMFKIQALMVDEEIEMCIEI